MRSRLSVLAMLLMVVALVLSACAPAAAPSAAPAAEGESTEAPAADSGEKIELRVAWWGSQDRHDRTIAAIEQFEALYPNIDVVYEFAGWGDYWTLMTTQAAGGNLPDVMQQDYARLEEWEKGFVCPVKHLPSES